MSNADPNLTVEHVADVLSLLERNWYDYFPVSGGSLPGHLDMPDSKEKEIRGQHQSQQLASLSAYIVQFIPGISWAVIAVRKEHYRQQKDTPKGRRVSCEPG